MDAIVDIKASTALNRVLPNRPTHEEAMEAVRTLIAWAGDDPSREGLLDTPKRVTKAFGEFFAGYAEDPAEVLARTFKEVGGYDDIVLVKDIPFSSHCEHHMVPFVGKAHIAYLPHDGVVGLSKLARLVEVFSRRLQVQENMTAQIIDAINENLNPRGAAVMLEAEHMCMSMRGVQKQNSVMTTSVMLGRMRDNPATRQEFLSLARAPRD